MNNLVNGIYIFIMILVFGLAVWSFLFGGTETDFENMCIMIIGAVLAIAAVFLVLIDGGNDNERF